MADREDKTNLPSIPDGGLTDSMPDWPRETIGIDLSRDREVTAPEFNDYKRRIDALIHKGNRSAA